MVLTCVNILFCNKSYCFSFTKIIYKIRLYFLIRFIKKNNIFSGPFLVRARETHPVGRAPLPHALSGRLEIPTPSISGRGTKRCKWAMPFFLLARPKCLMPSCAATRQWHRSDHISIAESTCRLAISVHASYTICVT